MVTGAAEADPILHLTRHEASPAPGFEIPIHFYCQDTHLCLTVHVYLYIVRSHKHFIIPIISVL